MVRLSTIQVDSPYSTACVMAANADMKNARSGFSMDWVSKRVSRVRPRHKIGVQLFRFIVELQRQSWFQQHRTGLILSQPFMTRSIRCFSVSSAQRCQVASANMPFRSDLGRLPAIARSAASAGASARLDPLYLCIGETQSCQFRTVLRPS